jgi:ATP-binding cassette subfamily F protein uup
MSLMGLRNVVLGFGGVALFDGLSLHLEEGERLCLIGRNGAGKSTLLRVMARQEVPDDGIVEYRQGLRVGLLPQEIPDDLDGTALDIAWAGLGEDANLAASPELGQTVSSVLSRLFVDAAARFSSMSGGMKRRVLLARALAGDPDVLLLDEPTNHLDIGAIEWLEGFLTRRGKVLVFVSHDRAFADAVATRIVELDRGRLSSWPGRYGDYVRRKEESLEAEAKARARLDKKLAEEEAWIRRGIKARRTRNEGRVRALEALRARKRAELTSLGSVRMSASSGKSAAKRVIEAKGLAFSYPGVPIVEEFDTVIRKGDKVGIIGPNGAGKTTLLRLLLGELPPDAGTVRRGAGVTAAYLDQLREAVDDEKSLVENLVDKGDTVTVGGKSRHVIGYLNDFLFSSEAAFSPAKNLSGGERNRLLLAKLFARPADILVLDEPTNDLDMDTLEMLEALLVSFEGTVLLVTHDRTFLDNVVTSAVVFEGAGRVREYAGGYADWLAQREPLENAAPRKPRKPRQRPKPDGPKRLSYNEQRELEALPGTIEALETELGEIRERMARPDFYQQPKEAIKAAIERMEALEPLLEETYARWEALESRREA